MGGVIHVFDKLIIGCIIKEDENAGLLLAMPITFSRKIKKQEVYMNRLKLLVAVLAGIVIFVFGLVFGLSFQSQEISEIQTGLSEVLYVHQSTDKVYLLLQNGGEPQLEFIPSSYYNDLAVKFRAGDCILISRDPGGNKTIEIRARRIEISGK